MFFSDKFIQRGKEYATLDTHVPAPYLRRSFTIEQIPALAEITVCGLGFYELYLNGENITKGLMAPYISNPDDVLYYDNYAVQDKLKEGENVIGLLLGNGILNNPAGNVWDFEKAPYRDAPKVALALEIDGKLIFEGDENFKTHPSPITFEDFRAGEH